MHFVVGQNGMHYRTKNIYWTHNYASIGTTDHLLFQYATGTYGPGPGITMPS